MTEKLEMYAFNLVYHIIGHMATKNILKTQILHGHRGRHIGIYKGALQRRWSLRCVLYNASTTTPL